MAGALARRAIHCVVPSPFASMNPKIVFAFVLLAIAHQAQSACLCGPFGEGKDICSSSSSGKCAPLVIRPAQLPKIDVQTYTKPRVVCKTIGGGVNNPFKPLGDLCSCKQSIVVPAIVPRPVCACSSSSSSSGSSSSSSSSSSSNSQSSCGGGAIYVGSGSGSSASSLGDGYAATYLVDETGPTAAVVDPVSLALAYKEQNRACGISEGRLAYGFRKLPVDVVDERAEEEEIDEQGLHAHNGQIVELKKISCGGRVSNPDEEALAEIEALEADEFEQEVNSGTGSGFKNLRYKDVGFGIANVKKTPFREVVGIVETNPQPQETIVQCNDGYQPGNVIIKNTPQFETYAAGPSVPADCGASGEDYRPFYRYSTSSSSSNSNSNSNCQKCAHSRVYY